MAPAANEKRITKKIKKKKIPETPIFEPDQRIKIFFLGNGEKTFVIYVDPAIGNAINMTINQVKKERPLTHDLIGLILKGLETNIERVLINDVDEGTFFARIILRMENELGKKIIELDARPSDSIVLALQMKKPIHVSMRVLENVEDMSEILERILRKQD